MLQGPPPGFQEGAGLLMPVEVEEDVAPIDQVVVVGGQEGAAREQGDGLVDLLERRLRLVRRSRREPKTIRRLASMSRSPWCRAACRRAW